MENGVREYDYEEIIEEMFLRLTGRRQYNSYSKLVDECNSGKLQQEIFEWFFDCGYFDESNKAEKRHADCLADTMADDIINRIEAGRFVIPQWVEWEEPAEVF